MARPQKNNADYFSHDKTMRNDPRILALRRAYKTEGYGIWNMLLEVMCDTDGFQIDVSESSLEIMVGDFQVEPIFLKGIIDYLVTLRLFKQAGTKVWSEEFMRRMKPVIDKRERAKETFLKRTEKPKNHSVGTNEKVVEKKKVRNIVEECAVYNFLGLEDVKAVVTKTCSLINGSFPKLIHMKKGIQIEELIKIHKAYEFGEIIDVFASMQNKPDLLKKYESAYLTFLNWMKIRKS